MNELLDLVTGLPIELVYLLLGAGAALENIFPPVPADTFAALGGFLAGRDVLTPWRVFVVTWSANVASALVVYGIGHRYGRSFFEVGLGRYVLREHQLARMRRFYRRWGTFAIFFTRFVPGLRAVVPAFAGVSDQPLLPVALPLMVASAIWYGVLVAAGVMAGRNLELLASWLGHANTTLLVVATVLFALVGWWWWASRHPEEGEEDEGGGEHADGTSDPGAVGADDRPDGGGNAAGRGSVA